MKGYAVKSIWKTVQGEGYWIGRAAVFIRFVGCNMWSGYEKDRAKGQAMCSLFCDTDFTKENSRQLLCKDLVEEILSIAGNIRFCVFTGGEPLLQLDKSIITSLRDEGFSIAIETNGSISLTAVLGSDQKNWPDWIVCSPKTSDEKTVVERVDELKIVLPTYDPAEYKKVIQRVECFKIGDYPQQLLWVQPEDGPHIEEAIKQAVLYVQSNPEWRVSAQVHKYLGVD